MEKLRYMISETANLVNVDSHVLRYWEEELGLAIPRNELGHRYYTEDNMEQFRKIKEWKEQGYQLKAIRMMVQEDGMVHKEVSDRVRLVTEKQSAAKLEQFRSMMKEIVQEVVQENNAALGQELGHQVGDKVLKEMNYLMRVQEEAEEERFRKLDAAIREVRKRKRVKEEKPKKARGFLRKGKKLGSPNPNMGCM